MSDNHDLDAALKRLHADIVVGLQADVLAKACELKQEAERLAAEREDSRLLKVADLADQLIQCVVFGDESRGPDVGKRTDGPGPGTQ